MSNRISEVYFLDNREHHHYNILHKISKLLSAVKLKRTVRKGDITAIKLHFGEYGNSGFIRPLYIARIVEEVKKLGGKPYLTDGSTLYSGTRADAVEHIATAIKNGFSYSVTGAPIIISDGISGSNCINLPVDSGKHYKEVSVGGELETTNVIIAATHFKLHEISGIGGTIKNLSMGLASKAGKLSMHSTLMPYVQGDKCIKCLYCKDICPVDAVKVKKESVIIESKKCIGCGQCIRVCETKAVRIKWNAASVPCQEKMAEFVSAILKNKKAVFLNFILKVSPECDCYGHSDTAIVPDIGITASLDPVAIDKASADLVNAQTGITGSSLKSAFKPGEDKIKAVHPNIEWQVHLKHAEKMGAGTMNYKLINL